MYPSLTHLWVLISGVGRHKFSHFYCSAKSLTPFLSFKSQIEPRASWLSRSKWNRMERNRKRATVQSWSWNHIVNVFQLTFFSLGFPNSYKLSKGLLGIYYWKRREGGGMEGGKGRGRERGRRKRGLWKDPKILPPSISHLKALNQLLLIKRTEKTY